MVLGNSRIGEEVTNVSLIGSSPPPLTNVVLTHTLGRKHYELSNHLGNVLAVISDNKEPVQSLIHSNEVAFYVALQYTVNDYYPYGSNMQARTFNSSGYRFGFNGKEKENEINGPGDAYDYGMRFYDPRLGRFMSIDPIYKKYPELSTYQFATNSPISGIDQDGLEFFYSSSGKLLGHIGNSNEVWVVDNKKLTDKQATAMIRVLNAAGVKSDEKFRPLAEQYATDIHMTNKELNLRAMLHTIRVAEASFFTKDKGTKERTFHQGEPLGYDHNYGDYGKGSI